MPYVSGMGPSAAGDRPGSLAFPFGEHLATLEVASKRLLAAVSGGPDSVALLDLLVGCREALALDVVVAHVDHGIHPDGGAVGDQVRRLAGDYGLPFVRRKLILGPGASETVARVARYRVLEAMRRRARADLIVTGHHADDQSETVLMRALRGSGPSGLAAMAPRRGRVLRPLLPFRREDLARHLQVVGLSGWLDPANANPEHLRSWIRGAVLPTLRARLPDVDAQLGRVAEHASLDRAGWNALLDVLPGLDYREEPRGASVASTLLETIDDKLLICISMAIARRCEFSLGPDRAERVGRLVRSRVSGRLVQLGGGWIAELSFGRVRFSRLKRSGAVDPKALVGDTGAAAWAGWRFTWGPAAAPDRQDRAAMTAWFEPGALLVRPWREGERVRPLGGRRRLLVRCFQDARIPRTRRPGWPALEAGGSVVWVPGVCRSDLLLPRPGAEALRVDAQLG
jgi:tRNA(Ile)-lysidine synthase